MRKHKVKLSPNYNNVEDGVFATTGSFRIFCRILEKTLMTGKDIISEDELMEIGLEAQDEVLDELDAERIPYRLPQK